MNKPVIMLMVFCVALWSFGATHDDFVSVTNDWYHGNYSNVYALAQYREAHNTNDLVAAYIRYEWNAGFGTKVSISNSIARNIFDIGHVPVGASAIQ